MKAPENRFFAGTVPGAFGVEDIITQLIARYLYQILHGCEDLNCNQPTCKTNFTYFPGKRIKASAAFNMAAHLASLRGPTALCQKLLPDRLHYKIAYMIDESQPLASRIYIQRLETENNTKRPKQRRKKTVIPQGTDLILHIKNCYNNRHMVVMLCARTVPYAPWTFESMHDNSVKLPWKYLAPEPPTRHSPQTDEDNTLDKDKLHRELKIIDPSGMRTAATVIHLLTHRVDWRGNMVAKYGLENCTSVLLLYVRYLFEYCASRFQLNKNDTDAIFLSRAIVNLATSAAILFRAYLSAEEVRNNVYFHHIKLIYAAMDLYPKNYGFPMTTHLRFMPLFFAEFSEIFSTRIIEACLYKTALTWHHNSPASQSPYFHQLIASKLINNDKKYLELFSFYLGTRQPFLPSQFVNVQRTPSSQMVLRNLNQPHPPPVRNRATRMLDLKVPVHTNTRLLALRFANSRIMSFSRYCGNIATYAVFPIREMVEILKQDEITTTMLSYMMMQDPTRSFSEDILSQLFAPLEYQIFHIRNALPLKIDPDNVLKSALQEIDLARDSRLPYLFTVPLKVQFIGSEITADQGGVQVEFFRLLGIELMNPHNGFFVIDSDTKQAWFPEEGEISAKKIRKYENIGILFALAIFNGCAITVDFPTMFYRYLIKPFLFAGPEDSTVVDRFLNDENAVVSCFMDILPSHGKVFKQFKEDPDSIEAMQIPFVRLNNTKTTVHATDQVVSKSNYHEYIRVMAYDRMIINGFAKLNHILRGMQRIFPATYSQFFKKNDNSPAFQCLFNTVPPHIPVSAMEESQPFNLFYNFNSSELQVLMEGLRTVTVDDFKANAMYVGYDANKSVQIKWFWEILSTSFSQEDLILLLKFVTGSDRIPGSRKFWFIIQKFKTDEDVYFDDKTDAYIGSDSTDQSTERLPSSSVCFSTLYLPQYSTKEKLEKKLRLAVQYSTGFGLV